MVERSLGRKNQLLRDALDQGRWSYKPIDRLPNWLKDHLQESLEKGLIGENDVLHFQHAAEVWWTHTQISFAGLGLMVLSPIAIKLFNWDPAVLHVNWLPGIARTISTIRHEINNPDIRFSIFPGHLVSLSPGLGGGSAMALEIARRLGVPYASFLMAQYKESRLAKLFSKSKE